MPLVTDCKPDPERLAVIRECMETYGVDAGAPADEEWPWNVVSRRAVAYSCGRIARAGEAVEHRHDPEELALCRRLSAGAAAVMGGAAVDMGSESADPFRPFFVAANAGAAVAEAVNEELVRRAFGGTIYPAAVVTVEPLAEAGRWWEQVVAYGEGDEEYLRPWREMVRWFGGRGELRGPAFVLVDEPDVAGPERPSGAVFPRLAVALTGAGSLVGIGGYAVLS